MSFKAEAEYTLDDYRVCAKGVRLSQGVKFYVGKAIALLLLLFGCTVLCRLAEQMGRISAEEDRLVIDMIYAVCAAYYLFICTDRQQAKRMLKIKNVLKAVSLDDDGIKMIYDYGENLIHYSSVTNLYFSKGVWLIIYTFDVKRKKQVVITLPERCFIEGDPKEFSAYLSRMCGKEVKRF